MPSETETTKTEKRRRKTSGTLGKLGVPGKPSGPECSQCCARIYIVRLVAIYNLNYLALALRERFLETRVRGNMKNGACVA